MTEHEALVATLAAISAKRGAPSFYSDMWQPLWALPDYSGNRYPIWQYNQLGQIISDDDAKSENARRRRVWRERRGRGK